MWKNVDRSSHYRHILSRMFNAKINFVATWHIYYFGYADDLVKKFGKTDKYIRSRLQLRNLTGEVSKLLIKEEISLAIALELARYSHDIQKHVYDNHLSQDKDDTYSWKGLSAKEFTRLLENGYSADLSQYEFDKGDCQICASNSSQFDLFADKNRGYCQNLPCLQFKQGQGKRTKNALKSNLSSF